MSNSNKDSFIKLIMEKFSDKRKNMIDVNEKKISELEQKNDQAIKKMKKDVNDKIQIECSKLSSHFGHLKDSCRDRAIFLKKREIMVTAEKEVKEKLLELRGSERYYDFLKKELDNYIKDRDDDFLIYVFEEDYKKLKEITKLYKGNISMLPLSERRTKDFDLGGFCLKFVNESIFFDCTVATRLNRFLENHS